MAAGGQALAARSKKQNYNTHKRLLPHAKPALWGYMNEELQKLAAELKPQMVDFCQRLLRVPALSGEEKGVADLYLAEMEKLGYDKVFRDDWGNVVGIVKGTVAGPAIMYNGHLDHVHPGDYSEWGGYDPYGGAVDINSMFNQDMTAEEDAEVIHGRAAADVKGGGAAAVYAGALLLALRGKGVAIKGDFVMTMVVFEESAEMLGMIKLLEETFPAHGIKPSACVSCEATSLKLALGHRGRVEIKVTVQGVTSHGSAPWLGVNAVNKATKFIDRVEEVVKAEALHDAELGDSSIALTVISCSPGAMCIVPDRCVITYDRRFPPQESPESCIAQIQRIIDEISSADPDFKATVEVASQERVTYTGKAVTLPNQKEAYKLEQSHPVAQACAAALQSVGQPVKWRYWDFGTDLPVTHVRYKIPSIGYSGMQEFYCHRPVDKVRTDYLEKSIAGNAAIFFKLTELATEDFAL